MTSTTGAGAVVVSIEAPDAAAVVQTLGPDAADIELETQTDTHMLATIPTESPEAAHELVRRLRRHGHAAIVGPTTPGQQVGWDRRNGPTWFGDQNCVCFPWSRFDRSQATTVIEIDPAGGFGAGSHPTTLLVLEYLARGCAGRVLDVGCGSGVLSVGAALFGATEVVAVDIAAASIAATVANSIRNGVSHIITTSDTDLGDVRDPSGFDTIVANIHAPILTAMAVDFRRLLAPDATLVVSGVSRAQESLLAAALAPLRVVEQYERDDWVSLVLTSE